MPGERDYDDVLGGFAVPGNVSSVLPGLSDNRSAASAAEVLRRAESEAEAIRGELPLLQVTLRFEIAQAQEKGRAAQMRLDALNARFGEADARLHEADVRFEQAQARLDGAAADAQVLVREAVVQASILRADAQRASDQLLAEAKQQAHDVIEAAQAEAGRVAAQAEQSPAPAARAVPQDDAALTDGSRFAGLGERVGQILTLADEEAVRLRADGEHGAMAIRTAAEHEAAHTVAAARRDADEIVAEADRRADARRTEADALFEHQRVRMAGEDADFEQALAQRREMVESELRDYSAEATRQLDAAQQEVARLQHQLEQTLDEAALIRAEAESHASDIVVEAAQRARRIRADSDRERAAATRSRDDIEAQLGEVRQMLRTLAGPVEEPGSAEDGQERWDDDRPSGRHAATPGRPTIPAD